MSARAIAVMLLLAGAPAAADSSVPVKRPGGPSASDREAARRLYMEGVQRYDVGAFAEAAEKFERALALADAPQVLFNIGQARRLNGERAAALRAYRGYLARLPDTRYREEVERLIADLAHAPADGGAP